MNNYPFATRREILAKIVSDDDFAVTCLVALAVRQTADEVADKTTRWVNKRGFMASHAKRGTELAYKAECGDTLSAEEVSEIKGFCIRYGRQLAAHFRVVALEQSPELVEQGKIFGVC